MINLPSVRNRQKTLATSLLLMAATAVFCAFPSSVFGSCQDIDPNAEPYKDEGNVVHCRCRAGYVKWNGRCHLVEEVRTRLEERIKNAQAGGRSTLYSYAQVSLGTAEKSVLDAITSVDALTHLKGADFAKQLLDVEVRLVQVLSSMGDCSQSDSELRTTCENIKTFQRIVHETKVELDKLPSPAH